MADNLVKFAQSLPVVKDQTSTYTLSELVVDLIDHAKSNMTANAIVVPVFRTFNVLLEADVLRELPNEVSGLSRCVTWEIGILQPYTEILQFNLVATYVFKKYWSAEKCTKDTRSYEDVRFFLLPSREYLLKKRFP